MGIENVRGFRSVTSMGALVLAQRRSVAARLPMAGPALVYVALFGAVGTWFPFAAVLLAARGLDLGAVGLLLALQGIVSLVAAPAWGSLVDRTGRSGTIILAAALIAAIGAVMLVVAQDALAIAVALAVLALGSAPLAPLVDSRAVAIAGESRERFARARAFGSLAFVTTSIAAGRIVADRSPDALFVLFVPLLVVTGIAAARLLGGDARPQGRRRATRSLRPGAGIARIVSRPGLLATLVGVGLVWIAVGVVNAFISIRLVQQGGDLGVVGLAFGISATVEVPIMLAFPVLARRASPAWLLVLGALAYAARAAAWGLAPDPMTAVLVSPLGGVGFALFYVGVVSVVSGAVPAEAQATAQGLYSGMTFSLGTVVGSALGGFLAPVLGLSGLFIASAVATAVGAGILARAMVTVSRAQRQAVSIAVDGHLATALPE
jgi:PPP family 3-phenylpropionic acid transporter